MSRQVLTKALSALSALAFAISPASALQMPVAGDVAISTRVSAKDYEPVDCGHERVLANIGSRFKTLATQVHHQPELAIDHISNVHQHRLERSNEDFPIARRYCGGTVHLSDGRERTLWYLIEGKMGYAGFFGDGVTFCVSGFDRWNVHNAWCRVLR